MQTLKVGSFPIEQIENLEALEHRLGSWFATLTYPVRQVATSRRFDMRVPSEQLQQSIKHLQRLSALVAPLMHAIDAQIQGNPTRDPQQCIAALTSEEQRFVVDAFRAQPDQQRLIAQTFASAAGTQDQHGWTDVANALSGVLWPLGWQLEMQRYYGELADRHLRAIDHYVLTWEPSHISGETIQAGLRHAVGRSVEIIEGMPPIISVPYRERPLRLAPDQPGYPYLAILQSYEFGGEWDARTLHDLLDVSFDVSIVVDVDTIPRNKAMRQAELAHAAAGALHREGKVVDTRSERVLHDSYRVMHGLRDESFHYVTLAILVSGETEAQLEQHVGEIIGRLGTLVRFTRVAGAQGELIKLWSKIPTRHLDIPRLQWNYLSHGLGCLGGLFGYHRASDVTGLLWGLDAVGKSPLFYDLFTDNQAAHMCVLGKTGYGKTLFLNMITMRAAAVLGWKVIGLDAENNGARIARAAGAGARCNFIGLHSAVNILDIVFDEHMKGGWIANQVQHVIDQLGMLLGEPGVNGAGQKIVHPRAWTISERGLLDRALTTFYSALDPHTAPAQMPVLNDVLMYLDQLQRHEADAIALEISDFLSGSLANTFDRPTEVDWDFTCQINYFDFKDVPENLRAFFYGQAVGAIFRYMRDPLRPLTPTLLLIDEFYLVAQTESVARMAAELAKVARKYKIGLIPVDQNPTTFLDNPYGRFIWENSVGKVLFHLDDMPAARIGEAINDLTERHLRYLTQAQPGEAIMIFRNDVYFTHVQVNPREARFFIGS